MKNTKQNTTQAQGYTDENIRECPRCYGDGLYMGSKDGGFAVSTDCELCGETGLVTLTDGVP